MTEIHLGLISQCQPPANDPQGSASEQPLQGMWWAAERRRLQAAGVGVWGGGQAGKAPAKARRQPRDCRARLCAGEGATCGVCTRRYGGRGAPAPGGGLRQGDSSSPHSGRSQPQVTAPRPWYLPTSGSEWQSPAESRRVMPPDAMNVNRGGGGRGWGAGTEAELPRD